MLKFHFISEKDLSKYNKETNSQIKKNNSFLLPLSLDINGGTLYLLDANTNYNDGKIGYSIYTAKLKTDELDNNVGYTVFIFKIYGSVIFLFICFLLFWSSLLY